MSTVLREEIHQQVEKHYAELAKSEESCCDDSCCGSSSTASRLYSPEELSAIPTDFSGQSHGCGNPQAIADLRPGERVLDLGSGAGLDVMLAARQVGPEGYVYGVDMTDAMLELARRNAAKAEATNVEFRKGHLEDLPLENESVDVIISNCVVNLSPDKGSALSEAFRVLAPGGRLAISDIVIDGTLDGLPVSAEQIRAGLSWAGCIAGALTIDEFKGTLGESGFEAIEVEIDHNYAIEDLNLLRDAPESLRTLPFDVLTDLIGRFGSASIRARKPA